MIQLITLELVFKNIDAMPNNGILYLPKNEVWSMCSHGAVLLEDLERDQADDQVPLFARDHELMYSLDIAVLRSIVDNLRLQEPNYDLNLLFSAFIHYYDNDSFLNIKASSGKGGRSTWGGGRNCLR